MSLNEAVTAEVNFPILGLDVSARRIGLAIAETAASLPQPLYTYQRNTRAEDLRQCVQLIEKYQIALVVIGLPLNMDGTEGERACWMRRFARHLQQLITVPVRLVDERLTTVEAQEKLAARGAGRAEIEEILDSVAAALILERFFAEIATAATEDKAMNKVDN